MATSTWKRMTAEEFIALPDEERHTELIDGEVVVSDPTVNHAALQMELAYAVMSWARATSAPVKVLGPTEVAVTEFDVYGPDLVVTEANPPLNERARLAGLPLIAVEIRSPSTWRYDTGRKRSVYELMGLPELWLVDGYEHAIRVFRRRHPEEQTFGIGFELTREGTLTSPLLPGFALPLSELF